MTVLDLGGEFLAIDGMVVERRALHIVEKLQEINPDLLVLAVDPARTEGLLEEPYQICEIGADGRVYKIFGVWELDDSVITRVQLADSRKFDIEAEIVKNNQQIKDQHRKEFEEKLDAQKDLVASIVDNNKSSYSYREEETGDLITIYDDKPSKREKKN